jgi:hypothetical protein
MKKYTKKHIKKLMNNKTLKTKKRVGSANKLGKDKITRKNNKTKGNNYNVSLKSKKTKKQTGSGFFRGAQCSGINLKLRLETKITCKLRKIIKKYFSNKNKKIEEITKIIDRYVNKNQLVLLQGVNLNKIKLYKGEEINITKKDPKSQLIEALSKIPKNNTFYNIQIILSQYCEIKGTTGFTKFVTVDVVTRFFFS